MIEVLREKELTGKAVFIPSLENLNASINMAMITATENAERQDELKQAVDTLMLGLAEIMEELEAKNE